MKFSVSKDEKSQVAKLTFLEGVPRVKDIFLKKKLFVRNKPSSKNELLQIMERVCREEQISEATFLNQFQCNRETIIAMEMEDLIKCYLRIKNAVENKDIAGPCK